jgi:hypothetical protein
MKNFWWNIKWKLIFKHWKIYVLPILNVLSRVGVIKDGGWIDDLHNSDVQAITALSLIYTLYKLPQHPGIIFQPAGLTSRSLAAASNIAHSSATVLAPLPAH